jgi:hypothetical protein
MLWPGEPMPFNYRVKRDNPEYVWGKDGKPNQDRSCLWPPKGSNWLNIPPEVTPRTTSGLDDSIRHR